MMDQTSAGVAWPQRTYAAGFLMSSYGITNGALWPQCYNIWATLAQANIVNAVLDVGTKNSSFKHDSWS